jgi:DNA topoisomerase-1
MASQQARKLVIVESPTKAKTISQFLGSEFRIEASMGHVRDLPASADQIPESVKGQPWARIGVNIEQNFEPLYIVPPEKKRVVAALKEALKGVEELYIATDEDREGESIGWHLIEVLKPKVPTFRMVFHEITPEAIREALANPRKMDQQLVQAQEMRRVLDRLVGYVVSPLLWKKIKPKLSAGRVQSAAVRLLVMRERERMAFHVASYWDLLSQLGKASGGKAVFSARMVSLDGQRLATGKDFDETTGALAADAKALLLDGDRAKALQAQLARATWRVAEVKRQPFSRSPLPPFTTSTLQQEANKRLGLSAKLTMQVAQKLYESGFITYMRTDSVNLSQQALVAARDLVKARYGAASLSAQPRVFKTTAKGAQEAHEAIRPAGTQMPTAQQLGLSGAEASLYTMIWQRTVATQMIDAQFVSTSATIEARPAEGKPLAVFRASGKETINPGFLQAYSAARDEDGDVSDDASDDGLPPLPPLVEGEVLRCDKLTADEHQTRPPARYTEASLVKALESNGIGRPSTYATIIDTIQRRGYVVTHSKQLVPTFTALAVANLLETTHGAIVDLAFTADMEGRLDDIAAGQSSDGFLDAFYRDHLLAGIEKGVETDPRAICTIRTPKTEPYEIRVGKFGPFIEYDPPSAPQPADGEPKAKKSISLPEDMAPADVDRALIEGLIHRAELGSKPLGTDPTSGLPVFVLTGRFGPYVQLGEGDDDPNQKPRRQSLPPTLMPEDVTLPQALQLLSLPRELGLHPETQKPILASIGRFGPYVQHERTFVSLKTDNVLSVSLARALTLFQEHAATKDRSKKSEPLLDLGLHPETQQPITILKGFFGPYIKYQDLNVSLSKDIDLDDFTLDHALVRIEAKIAAGPSLKRGRPKKAAPAKKTPTTKKAAPKKATTKKATPDATTDDAPKKAAPKKAAPKKATTKEATPDAAATAEATPPKRRGRPPKATT